MLDVTLAIAHHLLIFAIFGIVAVEFALVRPGISVARMAAVARLDTRYGMVAGTIVIVGFSRAIFAAKGWDYYAHNGFFWAKMATFAAVGLLSIVPTRAYLRWNRAQHAPDDAGIARVQRFLTAQVVLFMLLPVFAALMARGYGEWTR